MTLGVPDPIVRKVTGHRSRELERYQHLTPELRALTVNLIATELFRGKRARKERENGTPTGTVRWGEPLCRANQIGTLAAFFVVLFPLVKRMIGVGAVETVL